MEFLTFIGGVALLVLVLNLRGRVQKLEQFIKSVPLRTPGPNYQPQPQQLETQQPTTPVSLLDYIKQQLELGIGIGEIKKSLLAEGWQMPAIEEAFNSILPPAELDQPEIEPLPALPTLSDKFSDW